MKLSKLFAVAALGVAVALTGCGPTSDAPDASTHASTISEGSYIDSLSDGLHRVNFPTGEDEGMDCLVIKDRGFHTGYLLQLECAPSNNGTYEFNTIATGHLLETMPNGVNKLDIDGEHFEDGKDREYMIVKDRGFRAGYTTVIGHTMK